MPSTARSSSGSRRSTPCGAISTRTSSGRLRPERSAGSRRPAAPRRPITTTCFRTTAATCCGAEIDAARSVGLRFHPTRGSMDLGQSHGGLPPDHVVEDIDAILAATEAAIDAHHDPSFDVDAPHRRRALLAVLGDGQTAGRGRRSGSREGRPAAHACLRDARRGGLLPRAVQQHARRVHGLRRLARARRLVRPRSPPRRRVHRADGRDRHRRRALPVVERSPRRGYRSDPRPPRRGRARRPRRRRRGVQRGVRRCSRRCGTRCCSRGRGADRAR